MFMFGGSVSCRPFPVAQHFAWADVVPKAAAASSSVMSACYQRSSPLHNLHFYVIDRCLGSIWQ